MDEINDEFMTLETAMQTLEDLKENNSLMYGLILILPCYVTLVKIKQSTDELSDYEAVYNIYKHPDIGPFIKKMANEILTDKQFNYFFIKENFLN